MNKKSFIKVQNFAQNVLADYLLCLWAFAEASIWFILPDFLLPLYCIAAPEKRKRFVKLTVVFSFFGSLLMLWLCKNYPQQIKEIIFSLPFTSFKMLQKISSWDLPASSFQAFSGVPFKVWTYLAVCVKSWNIPFYLLLVFAGRAFRMFWIAEISAFIGQKFKVFFEKYFLWILIVYVLVVYFGLRALAC